MNPISVNPIAVLRLLALPLALWMIAPCSPRASAQDGQRLSGQDDTADKDYSAELPRFPPKSPQEAQDAFEVLAGFEVQLVAAEPLVSDPVAFAFDARGRMFVVEMRDYSEEETEHLGRIALLSDTNADGVMDQRTTFVEGLSWPTAIWPWRDGVLVAEPPRITWYRDVDNDGLSDQSEDWFIGFGRGNVQGLVNSLRWGVDGYIHGATSSAGADLEVLTLATGVNLGRRDFAIDPLTRTVQPENGGGQHGLSFNRWGEKFVTSNSDHLQQVIDLDQWLAAHASPVPIPATRRSIAEDGPQAEVFRASPVEPWRIVRTRLRVSGVAVGPVEGGGRAAGYFTGATGTWIVDQELGFGDGAETALVCDVGSNLVHRKRMIDHGLFWSGQRIDEATELLRSSDTWFRPVQLGDGPDGAIYIADMVREVIEHPKSLPPMIKKHLDLTSGRERGRIWRLTRSGAPVEPVAADLTSLTSAALVQLLEHRFPWQRRMASQLLVERADEGVRPTLVSAAKSSTSPEARVLALHVAERLGWFDSELAQAALGDKHERVLEHTVQLVAKTGLTGELVDQLDGLISSSPRVQLALAQASADMDQVSKFTILGRVLATADDELVQAVAGTAAGDDSWKLMRDYEIKNTAAHVQWLSVLMPVWARHVGDAEQDAWLRTQWTTDNPGLSNWLEALAGLSNHRDASVLLSVLGGPEKEKLFGKIESMLHDPANAKRLDWIGLLPEPVQTRWLQQSLAPHVAEATQQAVIRGLTWSNHPQLASELIARFTSMSPSVQQSALRFLVSRNEALAALAQALEEGRILSAHIPADVRQRLVSDRDASLATRFQASLSAVSQDRAQIINKYAAEMELHQDVSVTAGQAVFVRVCGQCHRMGEVGNDVGPPLKSLTDKSPQQLLETILDPNREVDPKFSSYSVLLDDGRAIAGIIREESSTQILFAESGGKVHRIAREEIEELKSNGISFMPVGLEEQITPEQMLGLIEFLRSGGTP